MAASGVKAKMPSVKAAKLTPLEQSTPDLYTLKKAAERLSISLRTLRRRIDLGLITVVRMGPRSPRVSEREIQRVLRDGAG